MKPSAAIPLMAAMCIQAFVFPIRSVLAQTSQENLAIQFQLVDDNLEQFAGAADPSKLAEQVRSNLAEWEFPLPANGPYSHRLQARLGELARRETPVGFSFSSGNSDPRAIDFQKADVLPISCALSTLDSRKVLLERETTFSAHALDKSMAKSAIADKLADQISTACLDVLEHAPLPKAQNRVKTVLFKPKWMPDIRVEERVIPATTPGQGGDNSAGGAEEPKKEVVIHNQGTPVIFQFGHERR